MVTRIGRFVVAAIACGLLGALAGAVLGGLAGVLVFPPAGPVFGFFLGTAGGFAAGLTGFIGSSIWEAPRFRVGGAIGAVASMAVFPFAIFFILPPLLAIAGGISFGLYLDKQIELEEPRFFLAKIMKRMLGSAATYPVRAKIASTIIVSIAIIVAWIILVWKFLLDNR